MCKNLCNNNYYNLNSSELSISSTNINSCNDVANFLQNMGVICSVTDNISIVPFGKKLLKENGCRIKIGTHDPNLINTNFWNKIKSEYNLECAYLHVEGKYKGCIMNYLRHSNCPST